mmetsp:Transcript_44976/g.118819  ORF Transcript_44976/g.118819 Transcript_44976/m.118819 type:complete len:991 (+) Transcript_44976:2-2974(+)
MDPPKPLVLPATPGRPRATAVQPERLEIEWDPVADSRICEVSAYMVFVVDQRTAVERVFKTRAAHVCMLTAVAVVPGGKYRVQVAAMNDAGSSVRSQLSDAVVAPFLCPGPIEIEDVTVRGTTLECLMRPPRMEGGSPVTHLQLTLEDVNNGKRSNISRVNLAAPEPLDAAALHWADEERRTQVRSRAASRWSQAVRTSTTVSKFAPVSRRGSTVNLSASTGRRASISPRRRASTLMPRKEIQMVEAVAQQSGVQGSMSSQADLGLGVYQGSVKAAVKIVIQGLEPEAIYRIHVRALNGVGASETRTSDPVATRGTPTPQVAVTLEELDDTSAKISWVCPRDKAVLGFLVRCTDVRGDSIVAQVEVDPAAWSCEFENLAPGRVYRFEVVPKVRRGTAPVLPAVEGRTAAERPSAPENLLCQISGQRQLRATWSPPDHDGGTPVLGYDVRLYDAKQVHDQLVVKETRVTRTQVVFKDLIPGVGYRISVTAVAQVGAGDVAWSDAVQVPAMAPAQPGHPEVTVVGDTIEVEWSPPEYDGGEEVRSYQVHRHDVTTLVGADGKLPVLHRQQMLKDPSVGELVATVPGTVTLAVVRGWRPGARYVFTVEAVTTVRSARAASDLLRVDPVGPGAPGIPAVARAGPAAAQLRWDAPEQDGGEAVSSYKVYDVGGGPPVAMGVVRRGASQAGRGRPAAPPGVLTVSDLLPGRAYEFAVTAVNSKGEGPLSEPAEPFTVPRVRPSVCGRPAVVLVGSSVKITFPGPVADGGSPFVTFTVFLHNDRDAVGHKLLAVEHIAPTYAEDLPELVTLSLPLTSGVPHRFRVRIQATTEAGLTSDLSPPSDEARMRLDVFGGPTRWKGAARNEAGARAVLYLRLVPDEYERIRSMESEDLVGYLQKRRKPGGSERVRGELEVVTPAGKLLREIQISGEIQEVDRKLRLAPKAKAFAAGAAAGVLQFAEDGRSFRGRLDFGGRGRESYDIRGDMDHGSDSEQEGG